MEPRRPDLPALRRAAMVVNARSRTGDEAFERAREWLTELGVPLHAAHRLHDPGRVPETVRAELRDGADLVILGGGDGTISTVVDFLAGSLPALGVLPLGTANDFARTLQIPGDLRQACETIAAGRVVDVDLGLVGESYFVNVASVGLSVAVTRRLSGRLKRYAGPLAYPMAAARALAGYRPFDARLTFPDADHDPVDLPRMLQVAVGNGRFYGGGNLVSPAAGIDDHTLDVYGIQAGRHRDLLGVARYFRSGQFVHSDSVAHLTTRRVAVETDPPLRLNVDGEIVGRTPQEFSVARNALHVIVPPDSTAASLDR